MSILFSDVHSYEYRARGGRVENVSIAAFDNGKNLVFINLFPVVGSYIWIFIVLITMVSKRFTNSNSFSQHCCENWCYPHFTAEELRHTDRIVKNIF